MGHYSPARALAMMCVIPALWPNAVSANTPRLFIPSLYVQVARDAHIPAKVLYSLAVTESKTTLSNGWVRPWPWTLNVKGKGYYFQSKRLACQALTLHLATTSLIDIGLTQLNWRYQKQHFNQPCDALEPKANLQHAAMLLKQGMRRHGNWAEAAGYFHRPAGGALAVKYQRHFVSNYNRY